MKSQTTPKHPRLAQLHDLPNFSLVLGGPLYQLLRRVRLSDDALLMVRQRVGVFILIVWLPLVVLTAIEGVLWGGDVVVPFLFDIEANVRFLVVMPVLIIAELVIHQRMQPLVKEFDARNLIPENAVGRFVDAVEAAFRLRNSIWAEILLIAVVYFLGVTVIWRHYVALNTATWYAAVSAEGISLTYSGRWYSHVSLPIFQFLLLRWYFRLFIWGAFIWRISRLPLRLVPTHPDRLGGLGFISHQIQAFNLLGLAHGALLAGNLANQIFFLGATLPQFKVEIVLVVVYVIILALGPLVLFGPQLAKTKRTGLIEYGNLAHQYVRDFDNKWLRGGNAQGELLLGSDDIQSLADLGNSFEIVNTMRILPVKRDDVIRLVVATLAPIVPLGLTMMSFEELFKTLLKVVF